MSLLFDRACRVDRRARKKRDFCRDDVNDDVNDERERASSSLAFFLK